MRLAFVVAALCLATIASAQSSNQPPRTKRIDKQTQTTTDGTPHPITVNVPEPDPKREDQEAQDRAANLEVQRQIGFATNGIAVITALQVFFGIGALLVAWRAANAAKTSAEAAERSVGLLRTQMAFTISQKRNADKQLRLQEQRHALENRGFLHIGGWGTPQLSDHQTNFFYALSNRGKTPITIERGEIRFSIDEPIQVRETFAIPPQTIGANEKTPDMLRPLATFKPIPTEARQGVFRSPGMTVLYLAGDIWYRDAFPDTPLHRKRFGVKHLMDGWYSADAVPNDEVDE